MNRIKRGLVEAINNFDVNDSDSFVTLRDIVCRVSDKREEYGDYFLDNLLYIAANKMRIFGYNKMNNFDNDYIEKFQLTAYQLVKDQVVERSYQSSSGSLLDYKQMEVLSIFDSLEEKKIILSAPTSFGKTRLLREIINKYKFDKIILIFPTNALLYENYYEILDFNRKKKLEYTIVNSSNIKEIKSDRVIFLLTPERYLKLRQEFPKLKIDFFFMDEVYKIDNFFNNEEEFDEDDRDKIFRIVLYMLSKEVGSYYLAGPYVNLDELGEGLKRYMEINNIHKIQVNEELVVKDIFNCNRDEIVIDRKNVKNYRDRKTMTIKLVSEILDSDSGPTLIYCATKLSVDSLASTLSQSNINESYSKDAQLKMFIMHLENRYSFRDGENILNWPIQKYLESNISVHYGDLPKYIQIEMLKLFNEGSTNVILSTTSITEGVNTNAKNLIFYGSKKGSKELKVFDVKNIIGRAGRYYHHFIGNVYLFDEEIEKKNNQEESESLDFITFTEKEISNVDIDNTDIDDLFGRNQKIKEQRERNIQESGIPRYIFEKNRTIDWESQIALFRQINSKSDISLQSYKKKLDSLSLFIRRENKSLEYIFEDLEKVHIVKPFEKTSYPAIAKTYSYKGIRGLIAYEVNKKKDTKSELKISEYTTCYRVAFKKMSSVVEYKVPKIY